MPSAIIEESELHALVDGELDAERRRRVEDHLLQHPEDAALVESWRRQNAALRAAFEPVALETPPAALRGLAARGGAGASQPIETGAIHWGRPGGSTRPVRRLEDLRKARRKQAFMMAAGALLLGGLIVGASFYAMNAAPSRKTAGASAAPGYIARAGVTYFTYVSDARAVEFDASRRDDLATWLLARVGYGKIPDLTSVGLRLLGGRLAPGVVAPAGLLLYENDQGARVGLYFERTDPTFASASPRAAPGLTTFEWRAANMAFVLIGPLGAEAMQSIAELAASEVVARDPAPSQSEAR